MLSQSPTHIGSHSINAGISGLDHHVARIVDHIGVIALTTLERVYASRSVKDVVSVVTCDSVGRGVSFAIDISSSSQYQRFQAFAQNCCRYCHDSIESATHRGAFNDDIASVVNVIGIVSSTTGHCVRTDSAIDRVVATVASQLVGQLVASHSHIG